MLTVNRHDCRFYAMPPDALQSKKTLLCLDSQGLALTRLWVLYEIWQTVVARTAQGLQVITNMDVDFKRLQKMFAHLDVMAAKSALDVRAG